MTTKDSKPNLRLPKLSMIVCSNEEIVGATISKKEQFSKGLMKNVHF